MEIAFQILIKKLLLTFRKQIHSKNKYKQCKVFIKLIPEDQLLAKVSDLCLLHMDCHFLLLFFFFLKGIRFYQGCSSYLLIWLGVFCLFFISFFKENNILMHRSQRTVHVARNKAHCVCAHVCACVCVCVWLSGKCVSL